MLQLKRGLVTFMTTCEITKATKTARLLSLSLTLSLSLSLNHLSFFCRKHYYTHVNDEKSLKYCRQLWPYCSMARPLTSALIAAARVGNQERCMQLLSQGADVDGANEVSREDEQIGGNV